MSSNVEVVRRPTKPLVMKLDPVNPSFVSLWRAMASHLLEIGVGFPGQRFSVLHPDRLLDNKGLIGFVS